MRIPELEIDHRTWWRIRRPKVLRCGFCRPNRGENAGRRPKHGRTKPRHKNHRDP